MNFFEEFFTQLSDIPDWLSGWLSGHWYSFQRWLYIIDDVSIWSLFFTISIIIPKSVCRKMNVRPVKLYFLLTAFTRDRGITCVADAITFWISFYRLKVLLLFPAAFTVGTTVFYFIKKQPVIFTSKS